MTDDQVPGAVPPEGFSEDVLTWLAQGDELVNTPVDAVELFEGESENENRAGGPVPSWRSHLQRWAQLWSASQPMMRRWVAGGAIALVFMTVGLIVQSASGSPARPAFAAKTAHDVEGHGEDKPKVPATALPVSNALPVSDAAAQVSPPKQTVTKQTVTKQTVTRNRHASRRPSARAHQLGAARRP